MYSNPQKILSTLTGKLKKLTEFLLMPHFVLRSSTRAGRPTGWYKILHQYYYRDEWELYDLDTDPQELYNLATDPKHQDIFHIMQKTFSDWLLETHDPWRCMPHSVLSQGNFTSWTMKLSSDT